MGTVRDIPVLLVDDTPWVRQKFQRLLVKHPNIHLVGQVSHREDTLERLRLFRPKVVLINIHIPGMDAVSTAREIRLRYPTIVVIGLNLIAQEDEHSERSRWKKETADRFRALGEPILHAKWKNRDRSDDTLPPYAAVC